MIDLKTIRKQKQMTLNDVSQKCGLAISQINRYETYFDIKNTSLQNVCKIAKGYDVLIWDLIDDENLKDDLREVIDYETGVFLDGDTSPFTEIKDIFGITQKDIIEKSGITQSQVSTWERRGMDKAKFKHFIIIAKAIKINMFLLIWDEKLQNLFCEVT